MNALQAELVAMIRSEGPIGIDRFMALALGHPRHGYYMTRDPFGLQGDFVTAPEISQIFGELLGLLAAMTWQAMGEPRRVAVVELGPGRGTLMADALRAAKALSGFVDVLEVHLVETSPVLRKAQGATLAASGHQPRWHLSIDELPTDLPLIVLANEFFDALPVRQFVRMNEGWHEKLIGADDQDRLMFGLSPEAATAITFPGPDGAIFETCPIGLDIMRRLAERICKQGGMALAIDYGHARSGFGDTLQAVRRHQFSPVLEAPGEADITTHVDFATLAIAAKRGGASVHPLLTQASLLDRLGIKHRAEILKRKTENPRAIDVAVERLAGTGETAMGKLFKALAITHPDLAPPAGFDSPDPNLE